MLIDGAKALGASVVSYATGGQRFARHATLPSSSHSANPARPERLEVVCCSPVRESIFEWCWHDRTAILATPVFGSPCAPQTMSSKSCRADYASRSAYAGTFSSVQASAGDSWALLAGGKHRSHPTIRLVWPSRCFNAAIYNPQNEVYIYLRSRS